MWETVCPPSVFCVQPDACLCVVLAGVAMMQIVGSPYVKAGHGANGKHPPPPPSGRCMLVNGCDDQGVRRAAVIVVLKDGFLHEQCDWLCWGWMSEIKRFRSLPFLCSSMMLCLWLFIDL